MDGIGLLFLIFCVGVIVDRWLVKPRQETPWREWDGLYPIDGETGQVERVFHAPYDQDKDASDG